MPTNPNQISIDATAALNCMLITVGQFLTNDDERAKVLDWADKLSAALRAYDALIIQQRERDQKPTPPSKDGKQ